MASSELEHDVALFDELINYRLKTSQVLANIAGSRLVIYDDLVHYHRLIDLVKYGEVIILHIPVENKMSGHWVMLWRNREGFNYFCPYALAIDQIMYSGSQFGQSLPHLSRLILTHPGQVMFNEIPLQQHKANVNTCGRWCIVRAMCRDMTEVEFSHFIGSQETDFWTPDRLVTSFTSHVDTSER